MQINKKSVWLLSICIIGFFIAGNYIILQRVDFLSDKDEAFHANICVKLFQDLMQGRFCPDYLYDPNWPRGFHFIAVLARIIFGPHLIFMTPTLFFVVLLFSAYKIGAFLKNKITGLLAALILSLYPGIYISSRHFDYEMAQAAMAALILYFLIRVDRFIDIKYSLLFGFFLALGLVVKQSIVFFIAGPFLVTLFYLLRSAPQNKVKLENFFIAFVAALALAFLGYYRVYFLRPEFIYEDVFKRLFVTDISGLPVNRLKDLLYYLPVIKNYYIGIPGIVLFLVCLPYFLLNNKEIRHSLFLASWFFVPFCILSVAALKSPHYAISYLPVFAIISAVGAAYIRPKVVAKLLIAVFLALNSLSYICYTFNILPKVKTSLISKDLYIDWGGWGLNASKVSNPTYLAAEYINKVAGKKETLIGTVYYPRDDTGDQWRTHCLRSLIQVYHSKYSVMDFVVYGNQKLIENCDFFIFIRSSSRQDAWLNYHTFAQDVIDANKEHSAIALYPEFVFDDQPEVTPTHWFLRLSRMNIKYLADYFPNLRLVKVIKGENSECLIYKNKAAKEKY